MLKTCGGMNLLVRHVGLDSGTIFGKMGMLVLVVVVVAA